jgi:hypothetical protein
MRLFPRDLIADYSQSLTPYGCTALYQLMTGIGVGLNSPSAFLKWMFPLLASA